MLAAVARPALSESSGKQKIWTKTSESGESGSCSLLGECIVAHEEMGWKRHPTCAATSALAICECDEQVLSF